MTLDISMLLWFYLAGDTVNMGCNDILMLVAAPLAPLSSWCEHRAPGNWSRSPGMWGLGAETATQIAASETRTVSWNWGPMVPVKERNTALNMKRPPYTWDLKGNNKWWSWILKFSLIHIFLHGNFERLFMTIEIFRAQYWQTDQRKEVTKPSVHDI